MQAPRTGRLRRIAGCGGVLAALAVLAIPMPGLAEDAHRLAAVMVFTVVFWVFEVVPLAVTALLAPCLAVVLGVAPAKQTFAPFADPLIFLFLGGFMIARGLAVQQADRRLALWLLTRRWIDGSPRRALVGVALVAFAIAMWISNTATAAMMVPIAMGLCATISETAASSDASTDGDVGTAFARYGEGVLIVLAYACSLGGVATPIGTAPNVLALGLLREANGVEIGFFEWVQFALPTALLTLAVALLWAFWRYPAPVRRIAGLTEQVHKQLTALGPVRAGERRVATVFGLAILGWLTPSLLVVLLGDAHPIAQWADTGLHEGVVAMIAGLCLCVLPASGVTGPPVLTWREAVEIDWGTLYLLGGGLALGKLMFSTGLAAAVAEQVLGAAGPLAAEPFGLLALATLLMITLTEVTSNTATTGMMVPVILAICSASGVDSVPVIVCATVAASYAFMLPVATPPNAIVYGTRAIRMGSMVRFGLVMDGVGYAILLALGFWLMG